MPLDKLLAELDEDTLGEFFSNNALHKARSYVSRVRAVEVSGNTLSAEVQGTQRAPYHTQVRLEARTFFGKRSVEIATRCSCPVGNRCKHAAALLMAARRPGTIVEKPRGEVLEWARTLGTRLARATKSGTTRKQVPYAIFYALTDVDDGEAMAFSLYKARVDPDGAFAGHGERWANYEQALLKPPSFVDEADLAVFRLLRRMQRNNLYGYLQFEDTIGAELLEAMLATGRAYAAADESQPLRRLTRGKVRQATLEWHPGKHGVSARIRSKPGDARILPTTPLWYLDARAAEAGTVSSKEAAALQSLMRLPPLNDSELPLVSAALHQHVPSLPVPGAHVRPLPQIDDDPQPLLILDSMPIWQIDPHRDYPHAVHGLYDFASAVFRYGEAVVPAGSDETLVTLADGRAARVVRQPKVEATAMKALEAAGFAPAPARKIHGYGDLPPRALGLASEAEWARFFNTQAPALKAAGWQIDCPPDFRHYVLKVDEWFADVGEADGGWFELTLGIEVDGQRLDLAPLLHTLFRHDPRWQDPAEVAQMPDALMIDLITDEGIRIQAPAARIKPLATTLIDLFDSDAVGTRRISAFDAPRLADALDSDWQRAGFEPIERWQEKLSGMQAVQPVPPPQGLELALRPYQLDGLAWLQHLRAHALGGVLADDMGLGKTAQTLAHLLIEKASGRMDRPSLVVLPTSLVFNWQREAARFAPSLKVLKLHGPDRTRHFDAIADHDVCLTTYPLVWRDIEALAAHQYHLLILDEAQTVKNPASQAAKAIRELDSRHRLCLTGTPLENHLGELWSQFDFLLPGFLGNNREFTRRWRTPIEKHGDTVRQGLLAKRLAPFILRRLKDQVATELPPKNIIIRSVQLTGRQRDLYETVRVAMDKRLREAIASRGLARSRIDILDALLKLRQVCCDARLLKTPTANKVKERAKLDLLMQMLPELVDEGRRVLVFSQFTDMLALIEAELQDRHIDYAILTGQTRKREEAVNRFQSGEIPVFLISLKAGGVGLNLTAADTVIHYDPWWNPAAEDQATDRAHRIGQDKPVFVYKLVVEGSIEEKILDLQSRKAELAASILGADAGTAAEKFDDESLAHLFAPLPEL